MPNYRRADYPGGTFFFTVVTFNRAPILTLDAVRVSLRNAITTVRRERPFAIDAWVLLPDHLHCIWSLPEGDSDYSVRWSMIKRLVSKQQAGCAVRTESDGDSRRKRRELPFWQRRFWEHQIRDETDYLRHVDYIHWNPVKHGYVTLAAEWPYSTFGRFVARGCYPRDWGGGRDEKSSDFGE